MEYSQSHQLPAPCQDNDVAGAMGNGGGGPNGGGSAGSKSSSSSFLCSRQASSRWIPTADQIRILRDLYFNCGVRSPSAEQIQRISARLRQYGKIEGKNVFYWFQNHKARERQKKRLAVDVAAAASNIKYNNSGNMLSTPAGVSPACTSPGAGVYCVGQVGANGCSAGSVLLDRSFMEYSGGDHLSGGLMMEGNMGGWVAVEPAAAMSPLYYHQPGPPCFYEQQHQPHYTYEQQQQQQQQQRGGREEEPVVLSPPHVAQMETLPLFPIRSEPPMRVELEEDYVGVRSHVNSQLDQYWSAGKANPPHDGHFPAAFYLDQPQRRRQQAEDPRRQYCRAYHGGSSINIGGASLELSLYTPTSQGCSAAPHHDPPLP